MNAQDEEEKEKYFDYYPYCEWEKCVLASWAGIYLIFFLFIWSNNITIIYIYYIAFKIINY